MNLEITHSYTVKIWITLVDQHESQAQTKNLCYKMYLLIMQFYNIRFNLNSKQNKNYKMY